MHQARELDRLETVLRGHRRILVGADDVQNALDAWNLISAAQSEINGIWNAVGFGIKEPVHRASAIAPLKGLPPNMVCDERGKIDRAAITNRAKGSYFVIRLDPTIGSVSRVVPLLREGVVAKGHLQDRRSLEWIPLGNRDSKALQVTQRILCAAKAEKSYRHIMLPKSKAAEAAPRRLSNARYRRRSLGR